jgi:hypothetical protein
MGFAERLKHLTMSRDEQPSAEALGPVGPVRRMGVVACVRAEITKLADRCDCGHNLIIGPISRRRWCPACSRYGPRKP